MSTWWSTVEPALRSCTHDKMPAYVAAEPYHPLLRAVLESKREERAAAEHGNLLAVPGSRRPSQAPSADGGAVASVRPRGYFAERWRSFVSTTLLQYVPLLAESSSKISAEGLVMPAAQTDSSTQGDRLSDARFAQLEERAAALPWSTLLKAFRAAFPGDAKACDPAPALNDVDLARVFVCWNQARRRLADAVRASMGGDVGACAGAAQGGVSGVRSLRRRSSAAYQTQPLDEILCLADGRADPGSEVESLTARKAAFLATVASEARNCDGIVAVGTVSRLRASTEGHPETATVRVFALVNEGVYVGDCVKGSLPPSVAAAAQHRRASSVQQSANASLTETPAQQTAAPSGVIVRQGFGELYTIDSYGFAGEWAKDRPVGWGRLTLPSGVTIQTQHWRLGVPTGVVHVARPHNHTLERLQLSEEGAVMHREVLEDVEMAPFEDPALGALPLAEARTLEARRHYDRNARRASSVAPGPTRATASQPNSRRGSVVATPVPASNLSKPPTLNERRQSTAVVIEPPEDGWSPSHAAGSPQARAAATGGGGLPASSTPSSASSSLTTYPNPSTFPSTSSQGMKAGFVAFAESPSSTPLAPPPAAKGQSMGSAATVSLKPLAEPLPAPGIIEVVPILDDGDDATRHHVAKHRHTHSPQGGAVFQSTLLLQPPSASSPQVGSLTVRPARLRPLDTGINNQADGHSSSPVLTPDSRRSSFVPAGWPAEGGTLGGIGGSRGDLTTMLSAQPLATRRLSPLPSDGGIPSPSTRFGVLAPLQATNR